MLEPLTFRVTAWTPSKRPRIASSAGYVHRTFTVKWIRRRHLDPDDQDRAGTARLRYDAALDPKRLPSCQESREESSRDRVLLLGYSLEPKNPLTRSPARFFRDAPSRVPRFRSN
jgi:hypothetical protein